MRYVRQALTTGKLTPFEVQVGERFFEMRVSPVVAEEYGNIYGVDVTERKLAEAAQRQSEERFGLLVESAPEAIFVQICGVFRLSQLCGGAHARGDHGG